MHRDCYLLTALRSRLAISMLIITHNLHVVRHIASRMAVMYMGRIVESGSTAGIFAQPCHPYTAALLSARPKPDPDAAPVRLEIGGEIPSLLFKPSGCEFHTRCPFAAARCKVEAPLPRVQQER